MSFRHVRLLLPDSRIDLNNCHYRPMPVITIHTATVFPLYKKFYGLKGDPFRLSPDHHFCYRYPSFAKGRAYMQYALQAAEGFVVVTGAPGMGKTTLINDLLADYGPRDYTVATLVNTMLEANEVLRSAAYEFGLNVEGMDTATVLHRLKQSFTQARHEGRPPLLVVDEAQNLTLNALEELRMLTNLQVDSKPLLQIFLVGQQQLREKLQDPALEQLRQRVTAAAHLRPLTQQQTSAYIIHRLKVVGWSGSPQVKGSIIPVIEAACEGVPRRINQFCSRLLLHGAVEQKNVLDGRDARVVFAELSEEHLSKVPINMDLDSDLDFISTEPDTGTARARHDHDLEENPDQLRAQHKVVMPPPQGDAVNVSASPLPTPSTRSTLPLLNEFDCTLGIPRMKEAYSGHSAAGSGASRRRGPADTQGEDRGLRAPPYRSPASGPKAHRNRFGLVLLVILLTMTGAVLWYEMDRERAEELLGLEIDSYLGRLHDEAQDTNDNDKPVSEAATNSSPIVPPGVAN